MGVKNLLDDAWIQMFAFLVLVSGGMSAHRLLASPRPAPAVPQAPVETRLFSSDEPPAVGPGAKAPAPAPAAPQVTGAGVSVFMKPKRPGQWTVDPSLPDDADSATLAQVLASARDGDAVYVRPGVYNESVVVSKSLSVVGVGKTKDDVRIWSTSALGVAVAGGKVAFKDLTIGNTESKFTTAIGIDKAELKLENVSVTAAGQAVRVTHGDFYAKSSDISGRIGVIAEEGSRLQLSECSISGKDVGLLIKGGGISGTVSKTRFSKSERAINVEGQAGLSVEGSEFSLDGPGGGVFAFSGADVSVKGSRFLLHDLSELGLFAQEATLKADGVLIQNSKGAAVIATHDASVTLSGATISKNGWFGVMSHAGSKVLIRKSTIADNKDCGLQANAGSFDLDRVQIHRNRCGIAFYADGTLVTNNSDFSGNEGGPLLVKPGTESGVAVRGEGNKGIQASGQAAAGPPASPRAVSRTQFSNDIFTLNPFRKKEGR